MAGPSGANLAGASLAGANLAGAKLAGSHLAGAHLAGASPTVKKIHMLPNLITLGNAFCGLLAVAKGIDALVYAGADSSIFYSKMATACWLIILAMVFDALDGKVARITNSFTDFGAQLDSFADAITFGVAPAILAKVLLEHEGPLVGYTGHPRLHFLAAATFALMAILRLARFNLETEPDQDAHAEFRGLPSPAAAGSVVSSILIYLGLRSPLTEMSEGTPTPIGALIGAIEPAEPTSLHGWALPALALLLPALGLLMVSRVRYVHIFSVLTSGRSNFFTLVFVLLGFLLFFAAPHQFLFVSFNGFVVFGVVRALVASRRGHARARQRAAESEG